jgi:hypothetical protein
MAEPYLKEKIDKKRHEYDAMRRNLMDRLEGMAQESEEILKKVYESVGKTSLSIGEHDFSGPDISMYPSDWGYFEKKKSYKINLKDDYEISVSPETKVERREKSTQRTGLAKILLGPEKIEKVKVEVPTGRLTVNFRPGGQWGYYEKLGRYYDKCKDDPTLVNIAKKIKEGGTVEDAEKFAELNKRIRELPSQIVEHLDKRVKELETARTLGSSKDVDKLDYIKADCQFCGAPNPDLKPVCGHCGHKAYEIPKKTKKHE